MIRFVFFFFLPLICAAANYQNSKNRMFNQYHQVNKRPSILKFLNKKLKLKKNSSERTTVKPDSWISTQIRSYRQFQTHQLESAPTALRNRSNGSSKLNLIWQNSFQNAPPKRVVSKKLGLMFRKITRQEKLKLAWNLWTNARHSQKRISSKTQMSAGGIWFAWILWRIIRK